MSRFRGYIGLNRGTKEIEPGIFEPVIEEVEVTGEIRHSGPRWSAQGMRDSLSARHVLSTVTPEDKIAEFTEVVYIWWQDRKWSVTEIEYKRPRIELTIGGLYNG